MRALLPLLVLAGCFKQPPNAVRRSKDLPDFRADVGSTFDVEVPAHDGTPLFTRVHLPEGQGPWPTLFTRVPYPIDGLLDSRCKLFVRYGYACAWQTVRGQGRSGGMWVPFAHESSDGLDALDWLVAQPWVGDAVALMGESYLAATQWAVAGELPPEVKTMVPMVFGTDTYAQAYEDGLFRHEIATAWMTFNPTRGIRPFSGGRYKKALRHRPRLTLDEVATGASVPWFRAYLGAPLRSDAFWQAPIARAFGSAPVQTAVPVLMVGGWGDVFTGPMLTTWEALASQAQSTLVVGPWDHLGREAADIPLDGLDDDIGLDADGYQTARVLDWLDHHLQGRPLRFEKGRVVTYVAGAGAWRSDASWPPPTSRRSWHLAAGQDPAACTGALTAEPGAGEAGWTYDPADPTPSRGGAGSLASVMLFFGSSKPGFVDQKGLCEDRQDMLGFQTEPLAEPLELAGRLTAELVVSADVADTSVNVRFVERRADGRDIHIREDITVLTLRDGPERRVSYEPGSPVTVHLETWLVAYRLSVGSRLLVEISPASFPRYEAHTNTTEPWATATETVVAHTRVIFEGSSVSLPVVVSD